MGSPMVEMRSIHKTFGTVRALVDVNFQASSGEIVAIVGENGAGKTTLMRLLYGADRPTSGEILIDGRPVHLRNAADGIAHGVGIVSQHYAIIPELDCLENLMLGDEPGWAIARDAATVKAQRLAEGMGFSFEWNAPARNLSPAGAQKLEILKLLWKGAKIMILDEPTAMLSPADSDALFDSLQQLADSGATVIVVTHRLPEVLEHCLRATVLRGGVLVAVKDVVDTNSSELAELIVGKSMEPVQNRTPPANPAECLSIRELTVRGYRGDEAVRSVDLAIRKGEVVGVAGVDGSGQRELFQAIAGHGEIVAGRIEFESRDWTRATPAERLASGLRLIPEDRHAEAVVDRWSLEENAVIGLQRSGEFFKKGWLDSGHRSSAATAMADRFQTKRGSMQSQMTDLSGGNQQRFVAARALYSEPRLILAFQAARGLDIHATQEVYQAIGEECDRGAAALVVSFDLDELLEHCDRVVVMNRGKLFVPPVGCEKDRAVIGELMVVSE